MLIGEWSLAVNHDQVFDFADPTTKSELRQLFREQLKVYATSPTVGGAFYWTLRMGSGWDPRPRTRTAPFDGGPVGQIAGTSASRSRRDYPFKVWSLLEMAEHGVIESVRWEDHEEGADDVCAVGGEEEGEVEGDLE